MFEQILKSHPASSYGQHLNFISLMIPDTDHTYMKILSSDNLSGCVSGYVYDVLWYFHNMQYICCSSVEIFAHIPLHNYELLHSNIITKCSKL